MEKSRTSLEPALMKILTLTLFALNSPKLTKSKFGSQPLIVFLVTG